ncbi:Protein CBG27486 [Caenorhabditis briggsae]|uniref:Protein CBG27486 n=1 Tax=Caenorhabditis briggsae TaxID=6238 RepID=B6IF01_CAEBR|nr:Protein CBG27486 [Caenorhabditis briggsae]CAR98481.1 Protein CBG27486 [Caenorhabditis briggsae]
MSPAVHVTRRQRYVASKKLLPAADLEFHEKAKKIVVLHMETCNYTTEKSEETEPVQRPKQKMLRKDCEECMKKAGLEKAPKILNAEKGQSRIGTMMEEKLNAIMKEQQCRISVRSVVGSKLKK